MKIILIATTRPWSKNKFICCDSHLYREMYVDFYEESLSI